eukprot:g19906.t1
METQRENERMKSLMSPDVRSIYQNKQWAFLLHLLERACRAANFTGKIRDRVMGLRQKFISGLHTDRDVPPSGFWAEVFDAEAEAADSEGDAVRKLRAAEFFRSSRKLPADTWAQPADIQEMQRQKDIMVAKGLWVPVEKTTSPVAVCFPVKQNQKVRLCIDMRKHNQCIRVRERMRLLGARATLEIASRLASSQETPATLFQSRRDVTADIANERDFVQNVLQAKDATVGLASGRGPATAEDVARADGADLAGSEYAFVPASDTKDVEAYYYNFAAADRSKNALAVPCLTAEEKAEFDAGRTPVKKDVVRRWDRIESLVTVFGHLVSVFEDVGVSEALMLVKVVVLRKLAPLYIDDVHLLDRLKSIGSSSALIDLLLALIGFSQQTHKQGRNWAPPGSPDEMAKLCLISLGLSYMRVGDRLEVAVPAAKIARLLEMLSDARGAMRERRLQRGDIESARGMFRYCAQLSIGAAGVAKALDPWCGDAFPRKIKDTKLRRQLIAALDLLSRCATTFTAKTIRKGYPAAVRHVYGDAAMGDLTKARPSATRKGWVGVSLCEIHIGALLVSADFASATGFTHHLKTIPAWVANMGPDICFFETFCAHVAQRYFAAALRAAKAFCVHHVDNTAECYSIVKGSPQSIGTQIVISALHEDLVGKQEVYWAWIASARNLSDPLTRLDKIKWLQGVLPTQFVALDSSSFQWDRYKEIHSVLAEIGRVEHAKARADRLKCKKRKIGAV